MLAMANRCPRPSLSPPSSSDASLPSTVTSTPSPSSTGSAASGGNSRTPQAVGSTRAGTVVCGLIGKFQCTAADGTDVKGTANSCRDSDSAVIANDGCPIPRGDPRSPHTLTGNRNECPDKAGIMGGGGTGGRVDTRPGEMRQAETDASVHSIRKRQRKTVVYSRLCLDDTLLGSTSLLGLNIRKANSSPGRETTSPAGEEKEDRARPSWCSGQAEVIRFPCVERLIELYANIIREKEAEMQRFMSSIVRDGDKSRLDKVGPPSAVGRERRRPGWGRSNGSGLQQGDMCKKGALPASVSLGSMPLTTPQPRTVLATVLSGDSKRTSPVLPIEVVERAVRSNENPSPAQSDEGWRSSTQQSPYGSSDEEERQLNQGKEEGKHKGSEAVSEYPATTEAMKNRDKVTRSASSDSALGLDDDLSQQEQQQMIASVGKVRRLTLGVSDIPLRSALLPVPEPSTLPSLTAPAAASEHCPTVVRSKMILEAQLIELPFACEIGASDQSGQQHQQLGCPPSASVSRRESAQSYISDTGEGVRYVRTPSVVVSDYSDDTMCGITLEEIEYFRRQRLRRGSADCESDISAASSCSNLNYCGSSISALEGCEYQCGLRTPERKVSDCSTCSTVSCDEDEGYSVVRAKLASLSLPSVAPPTSGSLPVPVEPCVPEQPASEDADVRICSKKKVSHTADCPESALSGGMNPA